MSRRSRPLFGKLGQRFCIHVCNTSVAIGNGQRSKTMRKLFMILSILKEPPDSNLVGQFKETQRNSKKLKETQRNSKKLKEVQRNSPDSSLEGQFIVPSNPVHISPVRSNVRKLTLRTVDNLKQKISLLAGIKGHHLR